MIFKIVLLVIWTCLLFQDVIFQWLTTNDIQLDNIDAEDPEVLLVINFTHAMKVIFTIDGSLNIQTKIIFCLDGPQKSWV